MTDIKNTIKLLVINLDERHLRLGFAALAIILLVVGAGAPSRDCGAC